MQESYFVNLHIKTYLNLWKINKIKKFYGAPLTFSPAAADTLITFLEDTGEDINSFDLIVTGDLGSLGLEMMKDILIKNNYKPKNLNDCGLLIYDLENQDVHSGGSGCGCSASVLTSYLISEIIKGKYKKILFMATGALMSTTTTQQGESIPGIAHLIEIVGG